MANAYRPKKLDKPSTRKFGWCIDGEHLDTVYHTKCFVVSVSGSKCACECHTEGSKKAAEVAAYMSTYEPPPQKEVE